MTIGVSGSRDVSGLCFDFGRHVPPDVLALNFKLKAETSISGAFLICEMPTVRWVRRIYTVRFNPRL